MFHSDDDTGQCDAPLILIRLHSSEILALPHSVLHWKSRNFLFCRSVTNTLHMENHEQCDKAAYQCESELIVEHKYTEREFLLDQNIRSVQIFLQLLRR